MNTDRVSACSYPLREEPLDYALKVISEAGFKKVDLLARMPHFSVTDPDYSMEELVRLADGYGVRIVNIGSYCGQAFASDSSEELDAAMSEMWKTLDAAKGLGARTIRVMPGSGERENIDKVVPHFRKAAERAEKLGIYMGIENHGGPISGNPEACKEISEKVGSKHFGVLYEPGNLMAADEDYQEAFEVFRDHIVHVHIKDGSYDADGKWQRTMLGDGVLDLQWIWDRVESTGYDGDYALEFEVGNIEPVETGCRKWYETWRDA
jgi:sugar phosphate isomerase/epimerase